MNKRKQKVWCDVEGADDYKLSAEVQGTSTGNIQSKLCAKIRELTIQRNLDAGATIVFKLSPAEVDEFANPER